MNYDLGENNYFKKQTVLIKLFYFDYFISLQ